MSGQTYALAKRADDLLGDGEWHNYEATLTSLMTLIPPGVAIRRAEQDRRSNFPPGSRAADAPPRKKHFDPSEQIASGRRSIVRDFLNNGLFETDRPGMQHSRNPDRKVRQLRRHRVLDGDPHRVQRDQLEAENHELRERLDRFVAYMKDNGHADAVDQLMAEPDG